MELQKKIEKLASRFEHHFKEGIKVREASLKSCQQAVLQSALLVAQCFRAGGKLLLCGNGGSAADCQHMAAEFVSRLRREFDRPGLPAIALTTDTSFLTAYANDINYQGVFARQVQALGKPEDVLLGISTSGSSPNVIEALKQAKLIGMKSLVLCGEKGPLADMADVAVQIPSSSTQHIQEMHLAVEHVICELVEEALFGKA